MAGVISVVVLLEFDMEFGCGAGGSFLWRFCGKVAVAGEELSGSGDAVGAGLRNVEFVAAVVVHGRANVPSVCTSGAP